MVLVNFFEQYKENSSCLISFLSFSELFAAFNCAKVIGNLLSIWLGVSIFKPFPGWFSRLKILNNILSIISIVFSFSSILAA